ncbi:hypothetical protein D3C76_427910 [compost metagenome]
MPLKFGGVLNVQPPAPPPAVQLLADLCHTWRCDGTINNSFISFKAEEDTDEHIT